MGTLYIGDIIKAGHFFCEPQSWPLGTHVGIVQTPFTEQHTSKRLDQILLIDHSMIGDRTIVFESFYGGLK
jgi:hypothetical protein